MIEIMISLLDPILLGPILATIVAFFALLLILYRFKNQTWSVKQWLISSMVLFVMWAALTIIMRLAPNKLIALWFLRGSFISLQVATYSIYRFHYLLVFRKTENRIATFGMATLVGLNTALSFNPYFLDAVKTVNGLYTDSFNLILLLLSLGFNLWAGLWVVRSLRRLDLFSSFYTPEGKRKTGQVIFSIIILGILIIGLSIWIGYSIGAQKTPDSTIFIFISLLTNGFLGYTYGYRPITNTLSPQRIWSFLVIDGTGIPVYDKSFGRVNRIGNEILFAGALNAVNSVLKYKLQSQSSLNSITMEDRAVMIRNKENFLFCLIVDYETLQFEILLEEITERIANNPLFFEENLRGNRRFDFIESYLMDMIKIK